MRASRLRTSQWTEPQQHHGQQNKKNTLQNPELNRSGSTLWTFSFHSSRRAAEMLPALRDVSIQLRHIIRAVDQKSRRTANCAERGLSWTPRISPKVGDPICAVLPPHPSML